MDKLFKIAETAEQLCISERELRRLISTGEIRARSHRRANPNAPRPRMFVLASDIALYKCKMLDKSDGSEPLELVQKQFWPCSIYFLYDGKALVYIGQSIALGQRLSEHKAKKAFDRHKSITVLKKDANAVERGLIAFYKPPLNKVHVNDKPEKYAEALRAYGFGSLVKS